MEFKFNDSKIKYSVLGEGPAIVLLHGFLESSSIWHTIAKAISNKFTVVALDLPGHGESDILAETHTMELMAEVVRELLEHLGLDQIILLGHSMGGYVTLALAEKYPEKIRHLILLNSTPEADSEARKKDRDRAIHLMDSHPESFIRMAIQNLFTETSRKSYANEIEALKLEALKFPLTGILANIRGMRDRKDRKNVLKTFKGPKMIIAGKLDPLVDFNTIQNTENQYFTKVISLENGHMGWLEDVDEIVKILHFID